MAATGHATTPAKLGYGDLARPLAGGYFDPEAGRPDWVAGVGGRKGAVSLVMSVHGLKTAA